MPRLVSAGNIICQSDTYDLLTTYSLHVVSGERLRLLTISETAGGLQDIWISAETLGWGWGVMIDVSSL